MSAGNYDLRDYQHRSVSMIQDEFNAGKRSVLLYLPTGSGKTGDWRLYLSRSCKHRQDGPVPGQQDRAIPNRQSRTCVASV